MESASTKSNTRKSGDFTGLAEKYSKYRPDYSRSVIDALVALVGKPIADVDYADVGAGTGILTRMIAAMGPRTTVAVEPNDDMRSWGEKDSAEHSIVWRKGAGEETGLESASYDLVTMASCFHWVDFDRGTRELHRVLRHGGRFAALWNPRLIEVNPVLVEIEEYLKKLVPEMKRVSSGRSEFADTLNERLWDSPYFTDVIHVEGRHVRTFTPDEYLNVWRSVNDVQVQAGAERFAKFLDFIQERTRDLEAIEATYLTRAWSARRVD